MSDISVVKSKSLFPVLHKVLKFESGSRFFLYNFLFVQFGLVFCFCNGGGKVLM